MKYLNNTPNSSGAYPAPQGHDARGTIPLTDEQAAMVTAYNGFVTIQENRDEAGAVSYSVEPNTEAWEAWKAAQPPEKPDPPTIEERLTALELAQLAQMGVTPNV